jgi:hypothetical protein
MMMFKNKFKCLETNKNARSTIAYIKYVENSDIAAGGMFDQANRPAEHAKDAIPFRLNCLDSKDKMNTETRKEL